MTDMNSKNKGLFIQELEKNSMQGIYNWDSLYSFFASLNEKVEYLVLRSYDEFIDGKFNTDHPDIDILCRDSKGFICIAKSVSRTKRKNDLIHQQVMVDGNLISLDVRHVGDGYYDKNWEDNMLRQRRLMNSFCYVMDEENYFYSLLYHVLIQKRKVSADYQKRLDEMANNLSARGVVLSVSLDTLQTFMRNKGYYFTYPEYAGGVANFSKVDKDLISIDIIIIFKRYIYSINRKLLNLFVR